MPYITQTARTVIAEGGPVTTAGELNYLITKALLSPEYAYGPILIIIANYLKYRGQSYAVFNDIVGALECARREFKRRKGGIDPTFLSDIADRFYDEVVSPYEDQKIQQNGDVY